MSLGVSGIIHSGADVPGFLGFPDDDLFVQFYQLGIFFPFFRAHTDKRNPMREPWLQSPRVQNVIRKSIHQRYEYIHYLYNLFFEASIHGTPIVRPMWYEFPQDVHTFDLDFQFMFGSNILVAPKIGQPRPHMASLGGTSPVEVYLPPNEEWYDFYSKYSMPHVDGFQRVHVSDAEQGTFVRCGTILPMLNMVHTEPRLSILSAIDDPVRLEVYPCHNKADGPHAIGTLYLDDGESHRHTHNERTRVHYIYDGNTVSVMKILKDENLYIHAATKIIDEVTIYGVD